MLLNEAAFVLGLSRTTSQITCVTSVGVLNRQAQEPVGLSPWVNGEEQQRSGLATVLNSTTMLRDK